MRDFFNSQFCFQKSANLPGFFVEYDTNIMKKVEIVDENPNVDERLDFSAIFDVYSMPDGQQLNILLLIFV